jgi:hypothetical protein
VDIGSLIENSLKEGEGWSVAEAEDMKSAETRTLNLTSSTRFLKYAQVRALSFSQKLDMEHLRTWVQTHLNSEITFSLNFMEVFTFLVFELVSELVSIGFDLQGDPNPVKEWDPRGINPDTCMAAPHFQVSSSTFILKYLLYYSSAQVVSRGVSLVDVGVIRRRKVT